MRATLIAAIASAGMIATFLIFDNPVNAALNAWTPSTIPPDWGSYRLRWEIGHALAAILSVIALTALLRASLSERDRRRALKG
jgi:ABC-type spermidine/putrescine transport system permease subunit II